MKEDDFTFIYESEAKNIYYMTGKSRFPFERKLPSIEFKTENELNLYMERLKELGFTAKIISPTEIQFVDPNCEFYENAKLPVYKDVSGVMTYTGYFRTVMDLPTLETVHKAKSYMREANEAVWAYKQIPEDISLGTCLPYNFSFIYQRDTMTVYSRPAESCRSFKRKLPSIEFKTENELNLYMETLKELGFTAKIISPTEIQFVDPNCEFYENAKLPVYKDVSGVMTYTGYFHTVTDLPKWETVLKAESYMYKAAAAVGEYKATKQIERLIDFGHDKVSTIINTKENKKGNKNRVNFNALNKDEFILLFISKKGNTRETYELVVLIISKKRAYEKSQNGKLEILVPHIYLKDTIGENSSNLKELSNILGLEVQVNSF